MKKLLWSLYFIWLGFISIIFQSVLLREITTSFYGNEIFYGLSLGIWFLFTGLGSLLAIRTKAFKDESSLPWSLLVIISGLFPALVFLIRYLRGVFLPLGETPGLGASVLMITLVLGAYCLLLGALFTLGVLSFGKKETNKAYFWETIGFGIGGGIFAFILTTTNFPLNNKLAKLSYGNSYENIVYIKNSKHNHILVTKIAGVKNFFLGGRLSFTDGDEYEAEKLLGILLPYANKKESTLILGDPNLAKRLVSDGGVKNVGFLELDHILFEQEKEMLGTEVDAYLGDPRKSLERMQENWDTIIFKAGNPETLLANRYYTVENFKHVNQALKKNGVFYLVLYIPSSYQSREALYFVSSIYESLAEVFPYGRFLLLEDEAVFIVGNQPVSTNKELIDPKWSKHFKFVDSDFRHQVVFEKIRDIGAKPNTDLEPTAFYHQQLFWQTIFSFELPRLIFKYSVITPLVLLGGYLAAYIISGEKRKLGLVMSSASFLLITIEVMIILFFQMKIGFLYNRLSLIFTAALLGMALGVRIGQKAEATLKNVNSMFFAFLLLLFTFYVGCGTPAANFSAFWLLAMFIPGVIAGAIFAMLNGLYLESEENPGFIYAFDLLGGSIGAFLASTLFLPVFGVHKVLLGLVILVVVNMWLIARHR